MPKVTVYVRREDYPKWQAIEEKTAFIHNALHWKQDSEILRTPGEAEKFLKATSAESCKHGADPKLCRFAKNGKACK